MTARARTQALGGLAAGLTLTVIALEFAHIWRRGRAPLPSESEDVVESGREAARETVEVAVTGYRSTPARENALFNLLVSYALTAAIARLSTHGIRARGEWGPFRNRVVGRHHIHHFIPGIALAFLAGGAAIVARSEAPDRYLAVPFGIGAALTLDEAALLVTLEDVYWTEEGILSVQVTLGALSLLGATALGLRFMRRGEQELLPPAALGFVTPSG